LYLDLNLDSKRIWTTVTVGARLGDPFLLLFGAVYEKHPQKIVEK